MTDLHVLAGDLRPPAPPKRRHLLSIGDLTRDDVERLRRGVALQRQPLGRLDRHAVADVG